MVGSYLHGNSVSCVCRDVEPGGGGLLVNPLTTDQPQRDGRFACPIWSDLDRKSQNSHGSGTESWRG